MSDQPDVRSGAADAPPGPAPPDDATAERWRLLRHIEAILDPVMGLLGIAFLAIVGIDLANTSLSPEAEALLNRIGSAIYAAFILDFLLRLLIVPDRKQFLRKNILLAASLVLPVLRPLGVLRLLPAAQAITASRAVAGTNRALDELSLMLRGKAFLYLILITLLVVLLGAGLVLQLDRPHANTPFHSYGDALWWSATVMTTMNNSDDPVSAWARVVAVAMRIYAVGVFTYLTATVASYYVNKVSSGTLPPPRGVRRDEADPS